jgi:hypothetical protein
MIEQEVSKMKKQLVCTAALLALFVAGNSPVHARGIDLGRGWMLSGELRTGWVQYDYANPDGDPSRNGGHQDSQGLYVVPRLSLQTPNWNGLYAKVTGAGATDFGINDPDREIYNYVFDPVELKSFAILQQAFVGYTTADKIHTALIGRNEMSTPMVDRDDWYMLANSFEVITYTNRSFADVMLTGGYFHKMSGVWDSAANGTEFHSMSDASFVADQDKMRADDKGVGYLGAQYDNGTHNVQLWGYHASELYNIYFGQYDFTAKTGSGFSYDFGAQYIGFRETGELADNATTTIDYDIFSVQFNGSFAGGFGFDTGAAKYSDGKGQGATLGAWGGYPYFASGVIFGFVEAGSLQNAASYKGQLSYVFSVAGLEDISLSLRYTFFDLDPGYSLSSSGTPQNSMNLFGATLGMNFFDHGRCDLQFEQGDLDGEPNVFGFKVIVGYRF